MSVLKARYTLRGARVNSVPFEMARHASELLEQNTGCTLEDWASRGGPTVEDFLFAYLGLSWTKSTRLTQYDCENALLRLEHLHYTET